MSLRRLDQLMTAARKADLKEIYGLRTEENPICSLASNQYCPYSGLGRQLSVNLNTWCSTPLASQLKRTTLGDRLLLHVQHTRVQSIEFYPFVVS
jgi:hypothetical protein